MRNVIPKMLAMLMLCVLSFSNVLAASAQTINIKERLPDGEYIVVINGVEQRTITADHARRIAERNAELDRLKRAQPLYEGQIAQLKLSIDLAKKDAALSDSMSKYERERAEKYLALYNGEQALRLQAEKLGGRGRVSKFFDHPITQIALKLTVPVAQTILTARRE